MSIKLVKKALEGDEYSLVLLTEFIQSNKISREDAEFIKNFKIANPNNDYLRACLMVWREPLNFQKASHLLKPLADNGNGFANNLLGIILQAKEVKKEMVPTHLQGAAHSRVRIKGDIFPKNYDVTVEINQKMDVDITDYKKQKNKKKSDAYYLIAYEADNPLGVLNYLFDNKATTTNNILKFAPLIYNRLSPGYQQTLMGIIQQHQNQLDTAEAYYQFARCYEKIGILPKVYEAFHQAIEFSDDTSGKYQRKLVKFIEHQVNTNRCGFFKTELDYNYLNKQLSALHKNLNSEDELIASYNVGNLEAIEKSKNKLKELGMELKNYKCIFQEKFNKFPPLKQQELSEKFKNINAFYEILRPTAASSNTPSQVVPGL